MTPSWFAAEEHQGLAAFWSVWALRMPRLLHDCSRLVADRPELAALGKQVMDLGSRPAPEEIVGLLEQGVAGDWRPLEVALTALGASLAGAGVAFSAWTGVADLLTRGLVAPLIEELGARPVLLCNALQAGQRLASRSMAAIGDGYVAASTPLRNQEPEVDDGAHLGQRSLSRLLESGIMGILVCDFVGNIKEANESFLETFGYSREELVSGRVKWVEMTPPEFRHLDDRAVEQLKARGVTRPWEKEYFHKNGNRIPILVGVAMLNDSECIAFVLDISERRSLEDMRAKSAELEAQNHRIRESSRLKSEFLANMSHELRTPLNSIMGFADLLHSGEVSADSSSYKDFLAEILSSGRHLLQLINDVLDLAKVESGKLTFRPERVELSNLITDAMAVLRSVAASKHIAIQVDVDSNLESVTLDPSRLKQVLYNYASNALKFTAEGGTVSLRARPEGADKFRLEVEDTGIGIAPAEIGQLFVEFQQLDAGIAKRHAGTGLGLALTKRIVEAQGGSVGVRSVVGSGSVFFAILPLVARSPDPGDKVPGLPSSPIDNQAPRILVVEDDSRDRAFLLQTLYEAGYDVELAATGGEALASCAGRVFDAITLDLLLPDMTGLEVLHQIRMEGKNTKTPVVVVSVVADGGLVGGFSVHDHLTKPLNGADLIASLHRAGLSEENDRSILVVDDDPSALRLIEAKLRRLGYRVHCCPRGDEGLAFATTRRPLAVVLDLLMPEMDGFEFLVRLRKAPDNLRTPVIVWTMKDLTVHDHERLRELAQAVVAKGDSGPATLANELRMLLSSKPVGPAT
jgi:PAS domain S-box-containing protein